MSLNHILQIFHCFPNMNNFHLKIDLTKQHFHHTAAAFYMVYYKLICLNRLFCPQTRSINPCHLWFRHPWSARNLLKRPSYKVTKLWAVLSMSWEEVVIGNWSRPDYWWHWQQSRPANDRGWLHEPNKILRIY